MFGKLARTVSNAMGSPWAFAVAVAVIVVWALTGPLFGFGDTWQLVINTGTTIITFLMVFLIQHTQNHNDKAMHAKLDELVRAGKSRNRFISLEDASEEELSEAIEELRAVRNKKQG